MTKVVYTFIMTSAGMQWTKSSYKRDLTSSNLTKIKTNVGNKQSLNEERTNRTNEK